MQCIYIDTVCVTNMVLLKNNYIFHVRERVLLTHLYIDTYVA